MSATDASPPEGGALSVDQAVELIAGPEEERGEVHEIEAAVDDGELTDEGGGDEDFSPPHFWSAEDKAAFAELPLHLQETVAAYEKNRDDAAARVIQEAAEARNFAEAQGAAAAALAEKLDAVLPQAVQAFADRWNGGQVDWAAVAAEVGPEEAAQLQASFAEDAEAVQRLAEVKAAADQQQFDSFVAAEFEKLRVIEPELADGRRGEARRQAVVRFLAESGIEPEQIRHIGALEMSLAYDALRYRLAASAMARPSRGTASRPGLAPAAAQPPRTSQQKRVEASKSRFKQKPTLDNAVAAILAKG